MNKVLRVKNNNFTTISNVFLRDKNLSIKAKGFLAVIMGLPSDWEFSIEGVCAILKEGKTAIYNVIDELKENNYCSLVTLRDEKGRIMGNDYTFFEEPYSNSPYMGNPNMDNQPQLNTKEIKKEINKKEIYKERKEEENLHSEFIDFAKEYKKLCGNHTVSGIESLFNEFTRRHKDWREVVPLLMPALKLEHHARETAKAKNTFYPLPKNLSTYLGRQRAWETWIDEIQSMKVDDYRPITNTQLLYNSMLKNYIFIGYFNGFIGDGYEDANRPNGATIILNNNRGTITWNKEESKWILKK